VNDSNLNYGSDELPRYKHESERARFYEKWEGYHTFLFKGRVMLGPEPKFLIISIILLNLPSIYFFASPLSVSV